MLLAPGVYGGGRGGILLQHGQKSILSWDCMTSNPPCQNQRPPKCFDRSHLLLQPQKILAMAITQDREGLPDAVRIWYGYLRQGRWPIWKVLFELLVCLSAASMHQHQCEVERKACCCCHGEAACRQDPMRMDSSTKGHRQHARSG